MAIKKIEIQDSNGDVYHPHTTGDVVFIDNKNISDILKQKLDKNSAGGIDLLAGDGKGLKIGGSRIFEHSDSGLYFRTKNNKGFDFTDSSIRPSNTDCTVGTNSIPFDNIHLGFPGIGRTGFTKLPNGIIIQWGTLNYNISNGRAVMNATLPIAFPNDIFLACPILSSNSFTAFSHLDTAVTDLDRWRAQFEVTVRGSAHSGSGVLYWIALGY